MNVPLLVQLSQMEQMKLYISNIITCTNVKLTIFRQGILPLVKLHLSTPALHAVCLCL